MPKGLLEAAYIDYYHAYLLLFKVIPQHPEFDKFSKKNDSPFYETYSQLRDIVGKEDNVVELERKLDARLYQSTKGTHTPPKRSVPRKPVASQSGNVLDPLAERFEHLRGPSGANNGNLQPIKDSRIYTQSDSDRLIHSSSNSSIDSANGFSYTTTAPLPPPLEQRLSSKTDIPRAVSRTPLIFPKTTMINTETLFKYLQHVPESVLLLDVRERQLFDESHISCPNVVCIEPVTLRSNMNDEALEDTLYISPAIEQKIFALRSTYELVIYYDTDSRSNSYRGGPAGDLQSVVLHNLVVAMYENAFSRPLKRPPCILVGGFEAWVDDYGGQYITGSPKSIISAANKKFNEANNYQAKYAKDISDYFKTVPLPLSSPNNTHDNKNSSLDDYRKTLPAASQNNHPQPNYSTRPDSSRQQNGYSSSQTSLVSTPKNSTTNGTPQVNLSPLQIASKEFTTGLQNLGNTCYMNCIIQCLAGTSALSLAFVDGSYKRYINVNSKLGYKGVLAQRFADLVQTMYKDNVSSVGPTALKYFSGTVRDIFRGSEQQDCQEFLTFILDGLHEDLNYSGDKDRLKELTEAEERRREDMSVRVASTIEWERYLKSDFSLIVDIMQGQYQSKLTCLTCGQTSTTYNAFSTLSLPIPLSSSRASLYDCFDLFTADEVLEGDDAWFCSNCKTHRHAAKKLRISRLPSVLIVHLKRFHQGGRRNGPHKLETFVTYPVQNLDLTRYWPDYIGDDLQRLSKLPLRGQKPPFLYDLYGVSNHFGSLKGGHYTSFVKKGRKGWCYFDDNRITGNIAEEYVINQHAYVLFFKRRGI